MRLLADIAQGETATADVFFLIAVIVAALAAVIAWPRPDPPAYSGWSWVLGWVALAFIALGLLVL